MGLGQGSGPLPAQAQGPITLTLEAQEPGPSRVSSTHPLLSPGLSFPACIPVEAVDPLVELSSVTLVLCLS